MVTLLTVRETEAKPSQSAIELVEARAKTEGIVVQGSTHGNFSSRGIRS
jgi:hypothetical protein